MTFRWTLVFLLAVALVANASLLACGDDDDDDDNDDNDSAGGGVCWYECTNLDGALVNQTFCYGEGGSGNLATEALKSNAECETYAQNACENSGYELNQVLFDTDCVSCDDASCEPEWTAEY